MKKIISLAVVVLSIIALVGCGKEQTSDVSVNDIMTSIKDTIASDMKEQGVPEENLKDGKLPGFMEEDLTEEKEAPFAPLEINKDDIEEGIALVQMMNVKSDEIIVLKAKDESKVEDLKAVLEKEKEKQIQVWEQYLPDQYEKVQNNIIKTKGKYLLYVTYDNSEKVEEIFDNALE